jgi:hypothetical protein
VNSDSIYPEFFKAGVGRLQRQPSWGRDFQGLFAALEHFRRDLAEQRQAKDILKTTELYVLGLGLFNTVGFFMANPKDLAFELAHCGPEDQTGLMDRLLGQEIKSGGFAWALRQNRPVFFNSQDDGQVVRGVFHTLGVATRRLGMFCGLLERERVPSQEITFNLLSILLGSSADALDGIRTTEELQNKVLAAHNNLQRALTENEILARLPAENPSPVLRVHRNGRVLFSNQAAAPALRSLGCQVGDLISGKWMELMTGAFAQGARHEFEAVLEGRVYDILIVPIPDAGYANFYGTDVTARRAAEREKESLIRELQDALAKVKTLSGLVPICAWCKKIRDDQGFWRQLEVFVQSHSDAVFTHGVCPECVKKVAGEQPGLPDNAGYPASGWTQGAR